MPAVLKITWDNVHDDACPVTGARASLVKELHRNPHDQYLLGAVPEYDHGGDQEAELCTCGHWADAQRVDLLSKALLDDEGDTDHTVVYELLQTLLPADDYRRLGAMLELCPLHHCDIRICADDGIHGDEVYDG